MRDTEAIRAYADGGCRGNGKPQNIGGYGIAIESGSRTQEYLAGFRNTTNSRTELLAAADALRLILSDPPVAGSSVEVVSDSAYVIDCLQQGWHVGWKARGWVTKAKTPVANLDLWKALLAAKHGLESLGCTVSYTHVRGHRGHPGNERCDELANMAMDRVAELDEFSPDTAEFIRAEAVGPAES